LGFSSSFELLKKQQRKQRREEKTLCQNRLDLPEEVQLHSEAELVLEEEEEVVVALVVEESVVVSQPQQQRHLVLESFLRRWRLRSHQRL